MPRPPTKVVYANAEAEANNDRGINVVTYERRKIADSYVERGKIGPEKYGDLVNQLKGTGKLWEDPDFPADSNSIYPNQPDRQFVWKRPRELVKNPALFEDGTSRFDIMQGELGDCWVLASLASLCSYPKLLRQVVPSDQDFESNYIGAFRFRFWKFGEWKEVIVDDRLPTEYNQLCFMHSSQTNEFWSALVEKAYAKFYSSYEALIGGSQAEAMVDFTGGLVETIYLEDPVPNLVSVMERNIAKSCIMGCSIDPGDDGQPECDVGNGLLGGHAYSITDAKKVTVNGQTYELVRVRNPWGNTEWTGDWSDDSSQWKNIPEAKRAELGLVFSNDGEFWMSVDDFNERFSKLECCHLSPDEFETETPTDGSKPIHTPGQWEMTTESGKWVAHVNAGGCRNFIDSYWTNPQYFIQLEDSDENDNIDQGQILVGLQQKDMRQNREPFLTIGYSIYKIPPTVNTSERLQTRFFKMNKAVARSEFGNCREVTGFHKLVPGTYVIIPSTFEPNEEAEFQLRIFCEKRPKSFELDNENAATVVSHDEVFKDSPDEAAARNEDLKSKFAALGKVIKWQQLQEILNQSIKLLDPSFKGFPDDAVHGIIELLDKDKSGAMEQDEFIELWKSLRVWTNVFETHDLNHNDSFDSFELRKALRTSGFVLSNRIFSLLATRYTLPETGTIPFGNFILCLVRLKHAFKHYDEELAKNGTADLDESFLFA